MYRLMIVDDDEMLRKSLVQNVDWAGQGIEVVAEAADGREALCRIDESMPQLIVTDIQMPIMDGLKLTETISRLYPDIKIILLTAYEEFEYAKKALEYKVSRYVLKYESQDKILEAVLDAAEQIEAESESRRLKGSNLDMQRRNFFREISCNKTSLEEIREQAEHLGIHVPEGYCLMASFKIEALKAMDEIHFLVQTKEWFRAIEDTIGRQCRNAGYDISFFQGKEYLNAVIVTGAEHVPGAEGRNLMNPSAEGSQNLMDLLGDAMSRLMIQLDIHLYAGIGRWYGSIDCIHESYMEALKINNLRDVLDREYPKRQYPLLEYRPDMFAEETLEELAGKVTRYINACYAKPDLSLERIADQVHLSANYVSTLFKKHYGMNISDYMIKIRMEHAARLLTDTNFKTYEIAERVGYTNSQYFSVLFKKSYGITPKEYRNQNKT